MAIPATSVFEVRSGGNDTNGGGFDSAGTGVDYSLQNAANTVGNNISTTNAVATGTTTITSTTATFTSDINGNIIYLAGGSGSLTAGRYKATFVSSTSITVDRTVAAGTGITLNIGGALATIGIFGSFGINGNICFVQNTGADGNTTYQFASASTNVATGTPSNSQLMFFQGYTSTRTLGNTDNRPKLQTAVNSATMFATGASTIQGFVLDGNTGGGFTASKLTSGGIFIRCLIENFNAATNGTCQFRFCVATGNTASIFFGVCSSCEAYANTATPFAFTAGGHSAIDCHSYANTGATTDGASGSTAGPHYFQNFNTYGNGRDGIRLVGASSATLVNCYGESNSGKDLNITTNGKVLINCGSLNNNTTLSNTVSNTGFITTTVSAYTNAAGNDLTINNAVSGGALLRALGDPATFPRGIMANYRDVGAAQHLDSSPISVETHNTVIAGRFSVNSY